jgi:PAS domain S-box-containing protein
MSTRQIQRFPTRPFVPYLVLIVGLLSTLIACFYIRRTSLAKDRIRFDNNVQELSTFIRGRPRLYMELLRAGSGVYTAKPEFKLSDFQNFVARLSLAGQYPGSQGLGLVARVPRAEKDSFVQSMQQQGLKGFSISSPADQDEFYPVVSFAALDPQATVPIGFDMHTDAVRREAMEHARDSALPSASGRVRLEGGDQNNPYGFIIYAPVYKTALVPENIDERRAAITGFLFSQFRAGDLVNAVFSSRNISDIDLCVYDGPRQTAETLLYDSNAATPGETGRFSQSTTIDVADRSWTLAFMSSPDFGSSSWFYIYSTAASGLLVSLVLFGLTRTQARARTAAELAAIELTESEATIRSTLSEREKAEAALMESQERYRELVENANDIVYTLSLDGEMTSVNKAAERITEYSRDELVGMKIYQILSQESGNTGMQMLEKKLAGQPRTNYEVDLISKSGNIVTLEISSRLFFKDDQPIGVHGIARNITDRRRAEEAMRAADQRALSEYERLLERISSLAQALGTARDLLTIFRGLRDFTMASVNCDGLFVSLYDALKDVRTACYGWGDGYEIDTSELPPMRVTTTGPNSRAIRTGEVVITDDYMASTSGSPGIIVGPDNGLRPETSLVVPMAVMGRIIGTIEVQSYERKAFGEESVTAMRMAANLAAVAIENVRLLDRESSARAAAEESNRLKDEFLATVSHELRTPLTAILGWSRMLETGALESDVAARAIETIRRNAKTQSQIIDDILDVSRIITGNLYLDLHPIELAPVIEAAINVVRPTADAKGIKIETEFDPDPAVVSGDGNRLQQVIWNLASNAVKFTPSGGRVTVGLHHKEGQILITVADTGMGISPEFIPFVFDRFRQADSTTTRQYGGLGLGLAIARHIVEIHGGTIAAFSNGESNGATFTVSLPVAESVSRVPQAAATENESDASLVADPMSLSGLHVLLVDDDEDTLELISAALTGKQARVTAVSSAGAALEVIKLSQPDVLVSDIAMPGEDGYELIQKVRALDFASKAIPAVAMTAYAKEEDRTRAFSSGFQGYLAKPVELTELIQAVAEAAGRN